MNSNLISEVKFGSMLIDHATPKRTKDFDRRNQEKLRKFLIYMKNKLGKDTYNFPIIEAGSNCFKIKITFEKGVAIPSNFREIVKGYAQDMVITTYADYDEILLPFPKKRSMCNIIRSDNLVLISSLVFIIMILAKFWYEYKKNFEVYQKQLEVFVSKRQ
jgi:hypothetical protein